MNIAFIWHGLYPWDIRLEKIADACSSAGHSVSLICKGKPGLAEQETIDAINVFRVFSRSLGNGIGSKFANYPLFFNPVWRSKTISVLKRSAVDVIIVRDLPLANLGLWAGKQLRKPVVFDMAENYPAALVAYQNPLYKPLLIGNAWLPRKYEQHAARHADHILVVAEEQRSRLIALGVEPQRITLVGNTPVQSFIDAGATGQSTPPSKELNLLYVGNLDKHRGADLLILALSRLRIEFPHLRVTLVGDGNHRKALHGMVNQLHLEDRVSLPGWVEWNRVADFIRESTICLIPHLRSEHTDTTLPNKLFDYMAFSKPVIASDCAPLKRIIEEESCGAVFRSGDVDDLIAKLTRAAQDPSFSQKGKNGRAATERKYNWTRDKERLIATLERASSTSVILSPSFGRRISAEA